MAWQHTSLSCALLLSSHLLRVPVSVRACARARSLALHHEVEVALGMRHVGRHQLVLINQHLRRVAARTTHGSVHVYLKTRTTTPPATTTCSMRWHVPPCCCKTLPKPCAATMSPHACADKGFVRACWAGSNKQRLASLPPSPCLQCSAAQRSAALTCTASGVRKAGMRGPKRIFLTPRCSSVSSTAVQCKQQQKFQK